MTGLMFPRQRSGAVDARPRDLESLGVLHAGPEERFDRIALLARQVFDVAGAGIALLDHNRPVLKAAIGLGPADSAQSTELARFATSNGGTTVLEEVPPGSGLGVLARQQPVRCYAGAQVSAPDGDQVGTLFVVDPRTRRFSTRDRTLLGELAWWVERELRRSAELDQAAQVQRALMPEGHPEVPGYEIAGVCVPCQGVGGDFFDWYLVPGRGVVMSLGDVMGKGMAAAIVMATANVVLRAAGHNSPPAAAVEFADVALRDQLESTGTMITLCHGELNPDTHELRYVDAGHGLMMTLPMDGSVRRRPDGLGSLPLGVHPDEKRPEITTRLDPGEVALVFSDGLLDLYDGTLDSIDVIAREARAVAGGGAAGIVAHFTEQAGDNVLRDDVTVLAVRRSPT